MRIDNGRLRDNSGIVCVLDNGRQIAVPKSDQRAQKRPTNSKREATASRRPMPGIPDRTGGGGRTSMRFHPDRTKG